MKIRNFLMATCNIAENLNLIQKNILAAYHKCDEAIRPKNVPQLLAVSKTKPKESIITAYNAGQRAFGENYIQELLEKSTDSELQEKCPDIQWHLIGNCQRSNINKLMGVNNLAMVETVSSTKLATALNGSLSKKGRDPLKVFVQINTSDEEQKNGISAEEVSETVAHIKKNCPLLEVVGLMTIGQLDNSLSDRGENPDFVRLWECRKKLCMDLSMDEDLIRLSMGMSHDYEVAIKYGATNVRVGSKIFGERLYTGSRPPPKPVENLS